MSDVMVRTAGAEEHEWTRHIEFVVRSLQARFGSTVEPALIRTEVEAGFAEHSTARVRNFVPILVEARVRSQLLRALPA